MQAPLAGGDLGVHVAAQPQGLGGCPTLLGRRQVGPLLVLTIFVIFFLDSLEFLI